MGTPVLQVEHRYEIHQPTMESASQAHIIESGAELWLTNVYTAPDYRGKGYARLVIERALADWPDRAIYLRVCPYADAPLDLEQLTHYYHQFGFEQTSVPGVMVRKGKG